MFSRHTLRAAALALSLLVFAAPSQAVCRVVPGPEGETSTWLTAGPWPLAPIRATPNVSAALHHALDAPLPGVTLADSDLRPGVASGGVAWHGLASSAAHLALGAGVHGSVRGARTAVAGFTLRTPTDGTWYLFLGTDDAVKVLLDGREIFRRENPRASREDDDAVPLQLAAGAHTLVIRVASRGELDLLTRFTNASFAPDAGLQLELPGISDAICQDLAARSVTFSTARRVVADGTEVELTITHPGGTAHLDTERMRVVSVSSPDLPADSRSIDLSGASVAPWSTRFVLPADGAHGRIAAEGTAHYNFSVSVSAAVRAALLRAGEVLPPLDPAYLRDGPALEPIPPPDSTATLSDAAIWSVEETAERLASLVSEGDSDSSHLTEEATTLTSLLASLAAGHDPYAGRHGPMRRAYRSPLDGTLQEYSIYVPPSYHGDRAFPLIVGLHGLHGSAHRMLPVLVGLYDESESRTHADRHLPPLPDTQAILVAPFGHGDSGYRQQGEYDVVRVVDEVRRAYRIDADRTYMTGLSMGGIGAAGIPLHYPGLFAAAAPLCGYHSYLIRSDTRGVRRPWELFLMEARSNADWAENGLDLPMYIVQGTHDLPLSNSQVLIDRYTALHYALESEWPPLGHNVWSQTYADGRIIPYFLRFHRTAEPRHIRFRTADLRWRQSTWLAVDALAAPGQWGDVDLTTDRRGTGELRTHNVSALTVTPPVSVFADGVHTVQFAADGDAVSVPVGTATSLQRVANHWQVVGPQSVETPHSHGPIREVYDAPLLFVAGTSDPAEARLNERVARAWARRPGIQIHYPVVREDAYTDAMGVGRTLVLVGTVRSNHLLARIADRLPVRFEGEAVHVGERTLHGTHLGAVMAAADPDHPERTVLVITGADALGVWRSRSLPDLVPDYVVYDDRVAPARGRVLLGPRATVLAAGFLDRNGHPVGDDRDTVTPTTAGGDED